MKKVLCTGAGGYIGHHVVKALLDMGADVLAADVRLDGVDPRARKVQADLFSEEPGLFERLGAPDACIHLAWRDGFVHNSPLHMGCLSDHYKFVRRMTDEGLSQIAIMGTMHEVGYWEGAIDEDTPCMPISQYGVAKDALRRSTQLMAKDKGFVWQWLRAYYIYGDDLRANSIFAKISKAEAEGKETFPFTSGKNQYDFIRVEALGRQLAACVMQKEVDGVINCCTGKPVTLAEQVEAYIRESGFHIRLQYGAFPDRPYDSPGVWGDDSKIQKIMGSIEA